MLSLLAASLLGIGAVPSADELDLLVRKGVERWDVPGLAIAVVHEDRPVLLRGYGKTSLESRSPVSPDTVFPLASCSKPVTATMLAALVDEKRIAWDDPVRKHLPDFRLKDPVASERATFRDLLCHRTGLTEHALLWYRSPLSVEERVRRLAFLEPASDFRSAFHYQTVAFGAAGLAGAKAAGKPWADVLVERVLRPLEMVASSPVEPKDSRTLASPHRRGKDGVIRVIPRYPLDQPDPAGSIHSTARDLVPFLRLHLRDLRLRELHEPCVVIPRGEVAALLNPETVQLSYGLGWIVQDYRGVKMVLHGGAIDGFRAHLAIVPDLKLGIAILGNLDNSLANFALANQIVDEFLADKRHVKPRDWNAEFLAFERLDRERDEARAKQLRNVLRPPNAAPLRPMEDYAGTYRDDAYGECRIVAGKNSLAFEWGEFRGPLEHFNDHVFLADGSPFRDAPFEFVAGSDGRIGAMRAMNRSFTRKKE